MRDADESRERGNIRPAASESIDSDNKTRDTGRSGGDPFDTKFISRALGGSDEFRNRKRPLSCRKTSSIGDARRGRRRRRGTKRLGTSRMLLACIFGRDGFFRDRNPAGTSSTNVNNKSMFRWEPVSGLSHCDTT